MYKTVSMFALAFAIGSCEVVIGQEKNIPGYLGGQVLPNSPISLEVLASHCDTQAIPRQGRSLERRC